MLLSLPLFNELCGKTFIDKLHERRKKSGEVKRDRLLGTSQILYLMIGVASFSKNRNLSDILCLLAPNNLISAISCCAFCKARDHFSP